MFGSKKFVGKYKGKKIKEKSWRKEKIKNKFKVDKFYLFVSAYLFYLFILLYKI